MSYLKITIMEGLFIILIVGLTGILISAVIDSIDFHNNLTMPLWIISILILMFVCLAGIYIESTPDIYIVRFDKTIEKNLHYRKSTYKLQNGTEIKLSRDSAYVINASNLPLEQETVGYCLDLDKVGTQIPDYSLDTLRNSILKYPKQNTILFRRVYLDYDIDIHDRRDEVRMTRIGIVGESAPAGNAYRRLTKSATDIATY